MYIHSILSSINLYLGNATMSQVFQTWDLSVGQTKIYAFLHSSGDGGKEKHTINNKGDK